MQVTVGNAWNGLVEALIENGRYASTSDIVEDGLRLVEERERKLGWLRAKIDKSVAAGGDLDELDIERALDEAEDRLRAEGH